MTDLGQLSIIHFSLQNDIPDLNQLVEIASRQITLIGEGDIFSGNYLYDFSDDHNDH